MAVAPFSEEWQCGSSQDLVVRVEEGDSNFYLLKDLWSGRQFRTSYSQLTFGVWTLYDFILTDDQAEVPMIVPGPTAYVPLSGRTLIVRLFAAFVRFVRVLVASPKEHSLQVFALLLFWTAVHCRAKQCSSMAGSPSVLTYVSVMLLARCTWLLQSSGACSVRGCLVNLTRFRGPVGVFRMPEA